MMSDGKDLALLSNEQFKFSFIIYFLTLYASAPDSSAAPAQDAQLKSHYEQLLSGVQKDLESQKELVTRTQQDLTAQREQVMAYSFLLIRSVLFQV